MPVHSLTWGRARATEDRSPIVLIKQCQLSWLHIATLFGALKLSKNFDIDFIKLLFTKLRLGLKNFKIVYRYTNCSHFLELANCSHFSGLSKLFTFSGYSKLFVFFRIEQIVSIFWNLANCSHFSGFSKLFTFTGI